MYVCICHGVTERRVEAEIRAGATTEAEVGDRCGAGTGCGSCVERICALLERSPHARSRMPVAV